MSRRRKPIKGQAESGASVIGIFKSIRGLPNRYLIVAGTCLLISVGGGLVFTDWWTVIPDSTQAGYVGRDSCIRCHAAEAKAFHDSHHDLAMDVANESTVLANFDDQQITHYGITSTMYRDGDRYMVNTEGPDGEMHDYEVSYVFGVEPLQQYMVEFDREESMPDSEVARLQVLRISWNTLEEKWFYLSPPDVDEKLHPTDPLHWTGPTQCWNTTCADCHSTNLRKNFDVDTGVYHTTFSEIDVSCEACHGPASLHVEMAIAKENLKTLFWDRKRGYGLANLKTESNKNQIESCAPCHSRRRILREGYHAGEPFEDYFSCELIGEQTYHADGQILDEVYVYGSFIQSKMYHQNIKCTDCHNPHTARVKYEGNLLCTSCHQHPAGKYDTPAHHQHQAGSTGALCVNCHMPASLYMDVDWRRDHSLRVPRPDLSLAHGTPNACTGCHIEEDRLSAETRREIVQYQDWIRLAREGNEEVADELNRVNQLMADAVDKWYGSEGRPDSPVAALLAARAGNEDAPQMLAGWIDDREQATIVRATAAMELVRFTDDTSAEIAVKALEDPDPAVIVASLGRLEIFLDQLATRAYAQQDPRMRNSVYEPIVELIAPKLRHARRVVRIEAARVLARVPLEIRRGLFSAQDRDAFEKGLEELENALMINNDRALAYVALGNVYESLNRIEDAEEAYRTGIRVEPYTSGPRTNLAAILERRAEAIMNDARRAVTQRNREEADRLANEAGLLAGEAAALRSDELRLLVIDADRLPNAASIQYRVGLALHLQGEVDAALERLERAHNLEPQEPQYLLGLALMYERMGRWQKAIAKARELTELVPEDESYQRVLDRIEAGQRAGRALDLENPSGPGN